MPVAVDTLRTKRTLENLLRHKDGGQTVAVRDIREFSAWLEHRYSRREIAFRPARALMQDLTGVPAEPDRINPLSPVDR